ncbi:hypothetical protein HPB47_025447 [Ixodes persulcatus]|uniref:Uncharacterized protein n=1 Tax=Ixodes persulcatus TaxID=34615 RepID=A0AC60Q1K8_IXOPE|nr:hypothetical protein HPB47_025447 [Ixodes persulcatus]
MSLDTIKDSCRFLDTNNLALQCRAKAIPISEFHPYLRGQAFRDLDKLARVANQIPADILAELSYRPPPPPEACLEPSCAWTGNSRRGMEERGPWQLHSHRIP